MKIFKIALINLVLLIIISLTVIAAPPFTQTSAETNNQNTIIIQYPKIQYFKLNEPFDLHFHIFDSNSSYLKSPNVECLFHLYNSSGMHIEIIPKLTWDPLDTEFEYEANLTKLTKTGIYPYIIQCNSTTPKQYGFFSGEIYLNREGLPPENNYQIMLGIIIALFALALFFGGFAMFFDNEVQPFLFLASLLSVVLLLNVAANLAVDSMLGETIIKLLFTAFWISLVAFLFLTFFVGIKFFTALKQSKTQGVQTTDPMLNKRLPK